MPAADLAERQPALRDHAAAGGPGRLTRRGSFPKRTRCGLYNGRMNKRTLPVALVQGKNHGDAVAHVSVIAERMAGAAKQGARLVLRQGLHSGCYFCQHESVDEFDLAEPLPGP